MISEKAEVLQIFNHEDRTYFIFKILDSPYEYLYFVHHSLPIFSLLYGVQFFAKFKDFNLASDKCFECGLGLNIQGGVSYDQDEKAEFDLSALQANKIITELNQRVEKKYHSLFKYF